MYKDGSLRTLCLKRRGIPDLIGSLMLGAQVFTYPHGPVQSSALNAGTGVSIFPTAMCSKDSLALGYFRDETQHLPMKPF